MDSQVADRYAESLFALAEAENAVDAYLKDIAGAVSKKENKSIVLRQIVDQNLIGGIRVQINDRVYDDSIKNKVEKLRNELLGK